MSLEAYLEKDTYPSRTARSLIAGFVGGLAGTAVKSLVERYLPVRKIEQRSAQIKIVDELSTKITGYPISEQNEALAEQLVSFPIGVSVAMGYAYGKKKRDALNIKDGIILGSSTWVSTHETSLPILGLESKPTNVPWRMQANELFAHVLFGVTTEVVRSLVNEQLKK